MSLLGSGQLLSGVPFGPEESSEEVPEEVSEEVVVSVEVVVSGEESGGGKIST